MDKTNHDSSVECENGFCPNGCYEPATLNAEGYYEIDNAGKLFWFAQQVNVKGNREIKGVLTADIDLENRPWTPIGSTGEDSNNFRGVFDGQGHTIKGLYVEGGRAGLGFFGEVRTGTVKNFTIYGEVVVNTEVNYVGGVIGSICGLNGDNDLERNGAVIQNITSFVNVTAKAHGIGMIGGFVGYANHESLIEQCAWYGTFDAGIYRVDSGAGGFIGKIQENTGEVTIRDCGAYGTIKTNYAKNSYNNTPTIYMGGFLSFSNTNAKTTLENCLFAGRFERGENLTDEARLGAFGTLESVNAIKNCYYLGDDGLAAVHSDSPLKPGSDNVDIKKVTAEQLKSGEVGYKLQEANEIWGQTIGTDAYPVLGGDKVYQGYTSCGGSGYTNSENASTVKPPHSDSAIYTDNGDGTHNATCSECLEVMVDNEAHTTEREENKATCAKQAVCDTCGASYGELGDHSTTAEGDRAADCNSKAYCSVCDSEYGYIDRDNHDSSVPYDNGFCPNRCYEPAVRDEETGVYYISNAGQLYWFAEKVNDGDTAIHGILTADIVVNENVLSRVAAGEVSSFRDWNPIGSKDDYKGSFNGNGKTISGLYYEEEKGDDVGLFGYLDGGTVKNLGVVDSYFSGRSHVGGIAGYNSGGTIENCYSSATVEGTSSVGGVTGGSSGTVTKCYNSGTVIGGSAAGGVVGSGAGAITNCYNNGTVSGDSNVGGVAGNTVGPMKNCYNSGTVSGKSNVGGIVGWNDGGTVTNCYYLADSETDGIDGTAFKTETQFKEGEVAYLLNGDQTDIVFKQTIGKENGNDTVPNFTGAVVYKVFDCGGIWYNNTGIPAHHTYDNGFCTECGAYQAAEGKGTEAAPYLISNAGQLYWFAAVVNKGYNDVAKNPAAHGKLTADIDLDAGAGWHYTWEPIGYYTGYEELYYTGTFDGGDFTVSGLNIYTSTDRLGLFGMLGEGGMVKNVKVADSTISGNNNVGGIVGWNEGTVSGCSFSGTVSGMWTGGIVGFNAGTVSDCTNSGTVSGEDAGGIVGENHGTVTGCTNSGTVGGSSYVGGITGTGNGYSVITNCTNSGKVSGTNEYAGGIAGYSNGTVTNCSNTAAVTGKMRVGGIAGGNSGSVTNCSNSGKVSGTDNYVGGIAGHMYYGTVTNSTNSGEVSGTDNYVGGIAGYMSTGGSVTNSYNTAAVTGTERVGGVVGYQGSNTTVSSCYSSGTASGSESGGVVGYSNSGTVTNCYYLVDDETTDETDGIDGTTFKTEAQFESGEVAYLLQGDQAEQVWGQDIDNGETVQSLPNFTGATVYYGYFSCGDSEKIYTNDSNASAEQIAHSTTANGDRAATCAKLAYCSVCEKEYGEVDTTNHDSSASFDSNGFCPNGCYEPAGGSGTETDPYTIGNAGQLYWFAAVVNKGYGHVAQNPAAHAKLTADITVNEGTMTAQTTNARVWVPIGFNRGSDTAGHYVGTFDGNGKTVGGLYFNWSAQDDAALFSAVGQGGIVKNVGLVNSYICGGDNVGGIAAYNDGTIMGCYNTAAISGREYVGGVVGENAENGKVINCYNTAAISATLTVGGVAGVNKGSITNCYNNAAVSSEMVAGGGIVGWNFDGTVTNCYYLATDETDGIDGTTYKTEAQFKIGEVAYLLNGDQTAIVFKQTIGTDAYPNFTGNRVYKGYGSCSPDELGYTNSENSSETKPAHSFDSNGFCTQVQGEVHYQPAGGSGTAGDPYTIGNAGQLYWFAAVVNEGYGDVARNTAAHAKLTADIVVNEGTMSAETTDARVWTPIGKDGTPYIGTFNGNMHTISGLYFNDSTANCVGLFGCTDIGSTVDYVGVINSYFAGRDYVGAIAGYGTGEITGCYSNGTVIGNEDVGGIAGFRSGGTIIRCYSSGSVSGNNSVGPILGRHGFGSASDCYYLADSETDRFDRTAFKTAEQFKSGEVAYLLNDGFGKTVFKQTIGTDAYPNYTGDLVYYGYLTCKDAEKLYTNNSAASANPVDHQGVVTSDGSTLTEACGVCDKVLGTFEMMDTTATFNAAEIPVNTTATGSFESEQLAITYYAEDGTQLTTVPRDAGSYTASVTVDNAVATAKLTIEKCEVTIVGLTGVSRAYEAGNVNVMVMGGMLSPALKTTLSPDITNASFVMADDKAGEKKPVTITGVALSGDDAKNCIFVQPTGVTVDITKAEQEKPDAPVAETVTYNSITLKQAEGYGVQYGIRSSAYGDWNWQESPVFTQLSFATEYDFAVMLVGDENHESTESSNITTIKTADAQVFTVTLNYNNNAENPYKSEVRIVEDEVIDLNDEEYAFSNSGYVFLYWADENGNKVESLTKAMDGKTVTAQWAESYRLWIGGKEVYAGNTSGEGWRYDPTTNTLTLTNANIQGIAPEGQYSAQQGEGILYYGDKALNLVLNEDNTVTAWSGTTVSPTAIESSADLIIDGSGTLNAIAEVPAATDDETVTSQEGCYAIRVVGTGSELVINGGTVNASAKTHQAITYLRAIVATDSITINGGTVNAEASCTVKSTGCSGAGIYMDSNGGAITINGGTVTAKGPDNVKTSAGIAAQVDGDVIINGGTVTATGGSAISDRSADSYGIETSYKDAYVIINGGTVIATGGSAVSEADEPEAYSKGIQGGIKVSISGAANVTATGGNAVTESVGIYAGEEGRDSETGQITYNGGISIKETAHVNAKGGSYGMVGLGSVNVDGSVTMEVEGGTLAVHGNAVDVSDEGDYTLTVKDKTGYTFKAFSDKNLDWNQPVLVKMEQGRKYSVNVKLTDMFGNPVGAFKPGITKLVLDTEADGTLPDDYFTTVNDSIVLDGASLYALSYIVDGFREFIDADTKFSGDDPIVDAYVIWGVNVGFRDINGNPIGQDDFIPRGNHPGYPEAPAVEGHSFTGWTPVLEDGKGINTNTIFTAQYEANTYKLTVVSLDAQAKEVTETYDVKYGAPIELPNDTILRDIELGCVRYAFSNWIIPEGVTDFTMPARDVTFTAKYNTSPSHNREQVDYLDPTCTEDGHEAYWRCINCGAYFDGNGDPIADIQAWLQGEGKIPMLGHDWYPVSYTWSKDYSTCTAKRICREDEDHVESETVNAVASEKTPASCTEEGWTAYTASFAAQWAQQQTKDVQNISLKKHTYGAPVEENRVDASCTEDGHYDQVTYCAVCKKELSREQVVIKAEGHKCDENGKCSVCGLQHAASVVHNGITQHYLTLPEAMLAANLKSGAEVILRADVTLTETVTALTDMTINLNGKTVTGPEGTSTVTIGSLTDSAAPAVTIKGGNVTVGNGTAVSVENGSVVVESGMLNGYNGLTVGYNGSAVISGGTVTGSHAGIDNRGKLTVSGGTVHAYELSGVSFTNIAAIINMGELTVSGGTLNAGSLGTIVLHDGTADLSGWANADGTVVYAEPMRADIPTADLKIPAGLVLLKGSELFTDAAFAKGSSVTVTVHKHDLTQVDAKAPTCTDIGWDAYEHCSDCDYTTYKEQAATDHAWSVSYDWSADGKTCTATHICGNDAAHNETEQVNAVGSIKTPATCTEQGWTTYTASFTAQWAAQQTKDVQDIAATDHSWTVTYDWSDDGKSCTATRTCGNDAQHVETAEATITSEETKAPTCTEKGETTYTANFDVDWAQDGQTKVVQDIPAKDHSWTVTYDWSDDGKSCTATRTCGNDAQHVETAKATITSEETKAPTCTEKGETTYTANFDVDWAQDGQTKVVQDIPAKGHTDEDDDYICDICDTKLCTEHSREIIPAVAPTCTATGWSEGVKCSICGEVLTAPELVAANGHSVTKVAAKAPTCTDIGWEAYEYCTVCDYSTYKEIGAKGHSVTKVAAKAPTCTDIGWEAYEYCTVCDYSTYKEIGAKGHSVTKVAAKAPTCTDIGWEAYEYCTVCDYTTYKELAAKGHTETTLPAVEPGCTSTGLTEGKKCSECGEILTKQEIVSAKGHTEGEAVIENNKPATCTVDGSFDTVIYCAVCGEELHRVTTVVPAKGHVDENDDFVCDICGEDLCTEHREIILPAVPATCTADGKTEGKQCSVCGDILVPQVIVPAAGHTKGDVVIENNVDASCTAEGKYDEVVYCSVCKVELSRHTVTVPAAGHTKAPAVEENTVPASCGKDGKYESVVYCSVCDAELSRETVIIPATGKHTAAPAVIENGKAASCTDDGSYDTVVYCSVCKAELSRETTVVPAKGHSYDKGVVTTEATCTAEGVMTYTCAACGHSYTEAIPATGHDYKAVVTEPTCTAKGYTTYTCGGCGDSYVSDYTDAKGHSYDKGVVTTAATCTAEGVMTYTCTACGHSYTEAIPATGHKAGDAVIENTVEATCTAEGSYDTVVYCSVCDAELSRVTTVVPATGHKDDDEDYICDICDTKLCTVHTEEILPAVPAGCTEAGLTEGKKCSVCGEILNAQVIVPAAGHKAGDAVIENTVEATCTADGSYDTVVYCSVCKAELSRVTTVVPAAGHKDDDEDYICDICDTKLCTEHKAEIIPAVPATCTEAGLTEGEKCSVCGVVLEAQTVVPALGHTEETIPAKAPTCTEEGLTEGVKCSVCGTVITEQQKVPALGHSYEAFVTAPTCTAKGYTTYICSLCDHSYTGDYVDALGHTEEVIPGYAATCTTEGLTDGIKCAVCGEVLKTQEVIPALGHTEEIIPGYAATCTEEGLTDGIKCAVCGEAVKAQEAIPALGHTEEVIPGYAATCTEEGLTDGIKCAVCDAVLKVQEVIPAMGHTEEILPAVAATCTEDGLTEGKKCSVCGEVPVAQEVITAIGHSWDAGKIIPNGYLKTCMLYTCQNDPAHTKKACLDKNHKAFMAGYPDGSFRPDGVMTRAEVATMFYAMVHEDYKTGYAYEETFSDVAEGVWYTEAVLQLAELGIVAGYPDGSFRPDATITRAEFAVMAIRLGQMEIGGTENFPDVSENDWFYSYVCTAVENGCVVGYPDGSFRPNASIKRGEAATIACGMMGRGEGAAFFDPMMDQLKVLSDIRGHWAFYWILEATNDHYYEP